MLSLVSGHESAAGVAKNQPAKLAAFDGQYETTARAPLYLFGWFDEKAETTHGVAIPGMLSILVRNDPDAVVPGLNDAAVLPDGRPPVNFTFQLYHIMVAVGFALIGLAAWAGFAWWRGTLADSRPLHGAIYLVLKTEGEVQARVRRWVNPLIIACILCYTIVTLATLLYIPQINEAFRREPWFFGIVVAVVLAIANIPREVNRGKEFFAFLLSCAAMAGLMAVFGVGSYPNLVFSNPLPEHSLPAFNAASSRGTLAVMLTIAIIGVPVVLVYTASIYWIFRGKVKFDKTSY